MKNVLSISGGKDSTAMTLLAYERQVESPMLVFADTGHEHPQTYEYLDYLDEWLGENWGVKIRRVRADFTRQMEVRRKNLRGLWEKDGIPEERIALALENLYPTGNPFLDLCKLKGRFPSTRARFCTQELKVLPIQRQVIEPLSAETDCLISWQGVRAEESPSRAKLPKKDIEFGEWEPEPKGHLIYRPLIHWTAEEVFDQHRKHGIKWNPLYEQGMGRVGCMPCIMCRKSEIKEISDRFPEEVDRVEAWENEANKTSKRGAASFFATDKTPQGRDAGPDASIPIRQVVEWAKTGKGGRHPDLFSDAEELPACSSQYGLCE